MQMCAQPSPAPQFSQFINQDRWHLPEAFYQVDGTHTIYIFTILRFLY